MTRRSHKATRRAARLRGVLGAVALAVAGVVTGPGALPAAAQLPLVLEADGVPSLAPMIERVSPAVVNIGVVGSQVRTQRNPLYDDPFFRRFFGTPPPQRAPRSRPRRGQGSGVIIGADKGYIVTNHHVVDKADEITVTLHDGREFEAELVGSDPEVDVAVLQVEAGDLATIALGDSDALRVGDFVVAIGNPFGLKQTVTSGIVSGLGRSGLGIEGYEDFIQTDASINVGNSGGALVNLKGELVGINTAILAPGGGSVGIGFAIPVRMVSSLVDQIVIHGEVQRGRLGVYIQDFTPELAEYFGLEPTRQGALITRVEPESPSERAGMEIGDLVISIGEREITGAAGLRNAVGLLRPGTVVEIGFIREGEAGTVEVRIEQRQPEREPGAGLHAQLDGAVLEAYRPEDDDDFREEGIRVVEVEAGSQAWNQGLRAADIIASVNRRRVTTLEELRAVLPRADGGLLLQLWRPGAGAMYLLMGR